MKNVIKLFAIFLLLSGMFSSKSAISADNEGQHGVRGAGLTSCAIYEKERNLKSQVYFIIASWMDGYITGTNQWANDTYDIFPFQSTELITSIKIDYQNNQKKLMWVLEKEQLNFILKLLFV